jgi:hypothetical protein
MTCEPEGETNRPKTQVFTTPKNEGRMARFRLDGLKEPPRLRLVPPVLPQEDPQHLVSRIQQWFDQLRPQNDVECELISRAARLSWALDRAERYETAHLAHQVRQAQMQLSEQRMNQVWDLGRKLLYDAGSPALRGERPPWVDNPASFLRGLETTAEGCRWLLERWGELRTLLQQGLRWTRPDRFKLVRLLGKFPTEAVNDPALNALFLAWDVLEPGCGESFWSACQRYQTYEAAFSDEQQWRELADRPRDGAEAGAFLSAVVAEQIERLEELVGAHEEIAGDEAEELADRASFDPSASFERLRRFQSAKNRELKQTLEAFFRLQKPEPGIENRNRKMTNDKGQMTDRECRTAKHGFQSADSKFRSADSRIPKENGDGPMANGQGTMTKDQGQGSNGTGSGGKPGDTISSDNPLAALLMRRLTELAVERLATKPAPVKIRSARAGEARRETETGENEANLQSTQVELAEELQSHSAATNEAKRSHL